jgi:hypothetical protein
MLGATAMIQAVDAVHAPVVKAPRHWFCVRPHVSTFGQLRLDVCDVRIKGYKHLLDSDQLWIMRLNWRTQRHKILNVNISSYTIKFIDFFFFNNQFWKGLIYGLEKRTQMSSILWNNMQTIQQLSAT